MVYFDYLYRKKGEEPMSEYLLILLWLAAMALFQRFVNVEETISIHGKKEKRVAWWFAVLVFIP